MSKAGARGAAIVQGVVTTAGQEAGLKVAVEKVGDRGLYGRGKRDGRGEAAESRAPGTDASPTSCRKHVENDTLAHHRL